MKIHFQNASNDSSGSDYSAMTTPPSSVAVPEAVEVCKFIDLIFMFSLELPYQVTIQ